LFDIDGKVYPEGADAPLRQLLTYDLELRLPSKNLVKWIAGHTADLELQGLLEKAEDNPQLLYGYLYGKDVVDLLRHHPVAGIDADMLVDALSPVVPRAYSISSSIRKHPVEVHILVATVRYFDNERLHNGASSTYLSDQLLAGDYLKCYFVANRHFTVPENGNAPMIMVGPGTGVAPFRGFLEEREMRGDKGDNWLFFGDRKMKRDFLYREELEAMVARGVLSRLDLAFSRDQKEKVYVQHRMLESSKELFSWLQRGAYFFVCGDADRMAHDVDRVLHLIVQQQGKMTEQQAADYVLKLQEAKRYVKDVY
jgi:sulfite reductase (NADPH) flavoprotein alpha-component